MQNFCSPSPSAHFQTIGLFSLAVIFIAISHRHGLLHAPAFLFSVPPSPSPRPATSLSPSPHPSLPPCPPSLTARDFSDSSCPSSDFFTALYDAGLACKPATIVDVGANKGYVVAELLSIFAPQLGVNPPALGSAIAASGKAFNPFTGCGMCDDCTKSPPPSAAAACPGPPAPIVVHAFEPTEDAFSMLEVQLAGIVRAGDAAGAVTLHLHRRPVVEDQAAAPTALFTNCRGGGEGCSIVGSAVEGAVRLNTSSLDLWAAGEGVGTVDVLVVDAEGFDPAVLRGGARMLAEGRVRVLAFEYNNQNLWATESLGDVVGWLDENGGFDCVLMQQGRAKRLTKCWNPSFEGRAWSNVLCVRREERLMHAALMRFV